MEKITYKVAHVGINCPDSDVAVAISARLGEIFGLPVEAGRSSVFLDKKVEFVKGPGRGKLGHVGLATVSVENALEDLRAAGIYPLLGTEKHGEDGSLTSIYMDLDVCGLAIHLMKG